MATWRAEALARLPELQQKIERADSVMALWDDIFRWAFVPAYEADPPNESMIARVYSFADWYVQAPEGPDAAHDPFSAVVTCFYEDIPAFRPAPEDMPRWFTYDEVVAGRQVFSYMIGDEQFGELLRYMDKNRRRYVPRERETSA